MNIYLLELVGKWISMLAVSLVTYFGYLNIEEVAIVIENENINKSTNIQQEIIPFETQEVYKSNMAQGVTRVATPGQDGVITFNKASEEKVVLQKKIDEVLYVGTGPRWQKKGELTGYGGDCLGCSGIVACRDNDGNNFNLLEQGKYYDDHEYGQIRIVAAPSGRLSNGMSFSCGTIVEVTLDDKPFKAVVLDRGIALENKFNEGIILFDLAFESEEKNLEDMLAVTRRGPSVNYEVLRWGF